MEQPATHAGSAADDEQLKERLRAKGVPQETISACSCNQDMRNFLGFLEMAEVETAKNGEPWIVIRMRDASFRPWAWDYIRPRTAKLQEILDNYAALRRVAVTSLDFRYQVGGARVDGNTDLTALPNGAQLDVVSDFRPPASPSPAKKPRTELASPRPRDDVLDDIRPTIDHTIDHINALRIHYRNKAATSGLDSKAITVETLAAEAWMDAYLEIQRRQAQQMVNGFSPPDEVKLAKYRNALTAAKRALTEINETSDDAPARAASALAEITKALEGETR